MKDLYANYKKHISEMCTGYHSYHTASPGERARADYFEKTMKKYGYKVRREEYKVRGWDFKYFSFCDVTAGKEVPFAACQYFSSSIDFEGELFVITHEMIADIENIEVKDKVLFVIDNRLGISDLCDLIERLEERGCLGAVFANFPSATGYASNKYCRSPYIKKIAVAAVGPAGALYVAANIKHTFRLKIEATPYDTVTDNVIGYVEGDEKKIVFGGHYDSSPLTEGAGDDVSGTAMVLEMARLLKDKNCGHTIEFVAFSAEEYCEKAPAHGAKGSNAYMERHNGENIVCMINFDDCCFSELFSKAELCVGHKEKLPEINWPMETNPECLCGDDVAFHDRGYPTVWIVARKTIPVLHTVCDSIDMIDFDAMVEVTKKYYDISTQIIMLS